MGMAASQARLLMLTARLHDVEFHAQSVQSAKLRLATQQDQVYEAYQRALDATSLTFTTIDSSGVRSDVIANYNNLFSEKSAKAATGSNYALIDSRGRLVVSDDIYNKYNDFLDSNYTQNANTFALYMLYRDGFQNSFDEDGNTQERIMYQMLAQINSHITGDNPDDELLELLESAGVNPLTPGGISGGQLQSLFNNQLHEDEKIALLNYFFNRYGTQVMNSAEVPAQDMSQYNYYVRMFGAIQAQGGCISINDFDGVDEGTAATNSEWLTAMIQSGQMTIRMINTDAHGNVTLSGTTVASDQNLSYTTTTQIDRTALARAEAEYEHALKVIDRKDKKYDLELNKLETERSALTKQYDSIKKVIDDNIERTFGIFS